MPIYDPFVDQPTNKKYYRRENIREIQKDLLNGITDKFLFAPYTEMVALLDLVWEFRNDSHGHKKIPNLQERLDAIDTYCTMLRQKYQENNDVRVLIEKAIQFSEQSINYRLEHIKTKHALEMQMQQEPIELQKQKDKLYRKEEEPIEILKHKDALFIKEEVPNFLQFKQSDEIQNNEEAQEKEFPEIQLQQEGLLQFVSPDFFPRNIQILGSGFFGLALQVTLKDNEANKNNIIQLRNSKFCPENKSATFVIKLSKKADKASLGELQAEATYGEKLRQYAEENNVNMFWSQSATLDGEPALISRFEKNGSVKQYLGSEKDPVTRAEKLITVLSSLYKNLEHIHNAGLLHCDIAARNILITDTGEAILGDLGNALPIDHLEQVVEQPKPCALEWMESDVIFENNFSVKSDLFSMKVAFLEIIGNCVSNNKYAIFAGMPRITNEEDSEKKFKAWRETHSDEDVFKLMLGNLMNAIRDSKMMNESTKEFYFGLLKNMHQFIFTNQNISPDASKTEFMNNAKNAFNHAMEETKNGLTVFESRYDASVKAKNEAMNKTIIENKHSESNPKLFSSTASILNGFGPDSITGYKNTNTNNVTENLSSVDTTEKAKIESEDEVKVENNNTNNEEKNEEKNGYANATTPPYKFTG